LLIAWRTKQYALEPRQYKDDTASTAGRADAPATLMSNCLCEWAEANRVALYPRGEASSTISPPPCGTSAAERALTASPFLSWRLARVLGSFGTWPIWRSALHWPL